MQAKRGDCYNGYTGAGSHGCVDVFCPCKVKSLRLRSGPNIMADLIPENRQLGDTCRLHYYYRGSPNYNRILFGGIGAAEISDSAKKGQNVI